ncbi:MAG: glutaredoxin family protein [Steroidobacterales bacterium]
MPLRPPAHFLLYSRPGCHLCELMQQRLADALPAGAYQVQIVDVDADPATRARWGHEIPVLVLGGKLVCHGSLDLEELHKALAQHH